MIVCIVFEGERIVGVFRTKRSAERYVEAYNKSIYNNNLSIEEFVVRE